MQNLVKFHKFVLKVLSGNEFFDIDQGPQLCYKFAKIDVY